MQNINQTITNFIPVGKQKTKINKSILSKSNHEKNTDTDGNMVYLKLENKLQNEFSVDKIKSGLRFAINLIRKYNYIMKYNYNINIPKLIPVNKPQSKIKQFIHEECPNEAKEASTMLRLKPKLLDDDPFGLLSHSQAEHDAFEIRESRYKLDDEIRPLNRELSELEFIDSIAVLLSSLSDDEVDLINAIYLNDENGFIKEKDRVVGSLFVKKKYLKEQERDLKSETKRVYANKCSSHLKELGIIKVTGAKHKRIYKEDGSGRLSGTRRWTRPNVGDHFDEQVTYDLIQTSKVMSIPKEVELKILESRNNRFSLSVHIIKSRLNYLTGRLGTEKRKISNLLIGLGITGSINKLIRFSFDVVVRAVSMITKKRGILTNPVNYLEKICYKMTKDEHGNTSVEKQPT